MHAVEIARLTQHDDQRRDNAQNDPADEDRTRMHIIGIVRLCRFRFGRLHLGLCYKNNQHLYYPLSNRALSRKKSDNLPRKNETCRISENLVYSLFRGLKYHKNTTNPSPPCYKGQFPASRLFSDHAKYPADELLYLKSYFLLDARCLPALNYPNHTGSPMLG